MSNDLAIPFIFTPHSSAGIDPEELDPLGYEMAEHDMTQRQFRMRKLLRPRLDLGDYKFEALIDWIEIDIRTGRSTNFATVQRRLRKLLHRRTWVKSVGGNPHHGDTRFTARIQDPTRDQLLEIGPTLQREFGLAAPIGINSIEIAVDIRPKSGELRDRLAMVVLLQRHVLVSRPEWTDRRDDARYVYTLPSGDSSKPSYVVQAIRGKAGSGDHSDRDLSNPLVRERILRVKSHRAPFIDSTLYFGREGGPAMVSIEHKTTNKRDPREKTFIYLPEKRCSARIEVRLQGRALEELGLRQLDDVFGYKFQKLQKQFFAFWLPTVPTFGKGMDPLDEMAARKHIEVFRNSGVYGLDRFEQAALEERRRTVRATIRYKRKSFGDLNDRIRVALRTLSRSMAVSNTADDQDGKAPLILRMAA